VRVRKLFALILVALLAMTVALAAVGCGQKTEESSTTTETTPEPAMMDTSAMDTTVMDTMPH
jgi:hypothetical protein